MTVMHQWISVPGFIFFLLCCFMSHGQQDDYIFHHLRNQDGLSQATNAYVYKDTRGFVWISSINGLNRFDGMHIRVYTPDKADPSSIFGENIQSKFFEDHNSDLWFCTYEAIHKYNWDHDCFDHYQVPMVGDISPLPDSKSEGRVGYHIFYLDPQENLWFILEMSELFTFHIPTGTFEYKGNIRGETVRSYPVSETNGQLKKILLRGLDWTGLEVVEMDSKMKIQHQYTLDLRSSTDLDGITKVVQEADSIVWILTTKALIRYSFNTKQEKVLSLQGGEDMVSLSDSILLIGTASRGLLTFHTKSWQFLSNQSWNPNMQTGLQGNNVKYLNIDRDQNIWISTEGVGISYAHPNKRKFKTTFFPEHVKKNTNIIPVQMFETGPESILCFTKYDGVLDITLHDDRLEIQSNEGMNRHLPSNVLEVAKDRKGSYWVSTWNGIFFHDPIEHHSTRVTDGTQVAYSIQPLRDGWVLLTSTDKGLYECRSTDKNHFILSLVPEVENDKGYDPVKLDHKGRIWLNKDVQEFIILDSTTYSTIATVPVKGFCYALVLSSDSTTIWAAATTGLYEIDATTLNLRNVHNSETGLPAIGFSSMLMDNTGRLWLTHYNGIIAFNPADGSFRSYTEEDGLPPLEFIQASFTRTNGELWFGAVGAITRFFPDSVKDIQTKAIPQITELLVNDKIPEKAPMCEITGATHITEIQKLSFRFKDNGLSFVVHALEYSAPKFNRVLYQMKDLDANPIEVASGTRVRYPDLQPGTYTFVLYALNSDGVQNPEPRELTIEIKPPFYRTWWFTILVVVFVISIIAYIIYLRFSKKLELQKVRLKLYENLHDDVGSRLTAIVLSAEDLERNEDISHPKLTNISQIARSIVGNMRRLVWAIDPENDRMNSILQKINHDKSQVLDDKIDFRIEVDPHLRNIIVPGEIRYQMSSICNEAFNNISKYAQASKVWVKVTREDKFLKMVVEDNGKGFDPQEKTKNALTGSGYGLANMQRRASRVGGKLIIQSRPGEGTRVEFTFPFKP
jgi:ligand-binding sensor domain-containing protein/anti-sigma regulatory factor (Ser/Thr protein kinase)